MKICTLILVLLLSAKSYAQKDSHKDVTIRTLECQATVDTIQLTGTITDGYEIFEGENNKNYYSVIHLTNKNKTYIINGLNSELGEVDPVSKRTSSTSNDESFGYEILGLQGFKACGVGLEKCFLALKSNLRLEENKLSIDSYTLTILGVEPFLSVQRVVHTGTLNCR